MLEVSVIVATYNRPGLLELALESLRRQNLSACRFEVIVVNNGSESVEPFLESWSSAAPETRRWCREDEPGLARARNRGLAIASAPWVAFLDDDGLAAPSWLELALVKIEKLGAGLDCLGGPVRPFYDVPRPEWFDDRWETFEWGDSPRFLKPGESFVGSNMIWRRARLMASGGFPTNLGMKAAKLGLGEESSVFHSIAGKYYYCPEMLVSHRVDPLKFSVSYRLRREFVTGATHGAMWRELSTLARGMHCARALLERCYWFLWEVAKWRKHPAGYLVKTLSHPAYLAGLAWGVLGGEPRC